MPRNKVILTLSFFSFIVILQFTIYHYSQTIDPIESYYKPKQYAKNAQKFSNLNVSWDELNKKLDEKLAEATEKKIILYWTANPWEGKIDGFTDSKQCGNCEITNKREAVSKLETKAVVIRFKDLLQNTFPAVRRLDQYYVWQNHESSSSLLPYRKVLRQYDDIFNITMTYRQDSDIWSPYNYMRGVMREVENDTEELIDKMVEKKHKLGIWLASNCAVTQGAVERLVYAESLVRDGLKVDLKGKCFSDPVKNLNLEEYKFFFSFENSLHCRDYITEKFFTNALKAGLVPIVFGTDKEDYELLAPPNSFIYAKDYSNKELINLLNYLDKNDTAYKEYFKWRLLPLESFIESRREITNCALCRFLHGINYDSVFKPNYKPTDDLFPGTAKSMQVPSFTDWTFLGENKECLIMPPVPWWAVAISPAVLCGSSLILIVSIFFLGVAYKLGYFSFVRNLMR